MAAATAAAADDTSSHYLATVSEGCGSEASSELGYVRCDRAIAIDCGGTRCKIVCFQRDFARDELPAFAMKDEGPQLPILENTQEPSNVLKYITIPTKRLGDFLTWCKRNGVVSHYCTEGCMDVVATGGGAFKFQEALKETLGVTLRPLSEMQTLVDGLGLLLGKAPKGEMFNYDWEARAKVDVAAEVRYPYLITSIGSGVSIIKVTGPGQWTRISGSCIGGGTFWGLSKLLTDVQSWEELEDVRQIGGEGGDNRNVDLVVGDIYGARGMATLGLSEHVIASSFGKCGLVGSDEEDAVEAPAHALGSSFDSDKIMRRSSSPFHSPTANSTQRAASGYSLRSARASPVQYLQDIRLEGGVSFNDPSRGERSSPSEEAFAGLKSTPFDSESDAEPQPLRYTHPSSPLHSAAKSPSVHPIEYGQRARRKRTKKTKRHARNDPAFNAPDICRSLLLMVANNIGQITYLNAKMHGVENVYFTGGFTQDNPYVWSKLSYAIHFWSKGEMKACFVKNDGYLGALGALMHKDAPASK
eukprot:TRINITY_DN19965_c0_g1_i1.p1 TRINITY_DN19965_c0_g1~~TRINITY_DN19965_c0_g1_i1.p1  ORF type:complete len:529 (+),score=161.91 TRINITY_DN19965_c0_g1_i1:55-1641(+)